MRSFLPRGKARIIIPIVLVLAILLGVGVILFLGSPEYALIRVALDIDRSGIAGVRPHLTGEALRDFDAIEAITEDELVSAIIALFGQDDYMRLIKAHLPDMTWSLEGITKGEGTAEVLIAFEYRESFDGVLALTVSKPEGEWKISAFSISDINIH